MQNQKTLIITHKPGAQYFSYRVQDEGHTHEFGTNPLTLLPLRIGLSRRFYPGCHIVVEDQSFKEFPPMQPEQVEFKELVADVATLGAALIALAIGLTAALPLLKLIAVIVFWVLCISFCVKSWMLVNRIQRSVHVFKLNLRQKDELESKESSPVDER